MQSFNPANYLDKRVRLSGYIKSKDVKDWAGMWFRIDGGDKKPLGFDNMQTRPIKGTTAWKKEDSVMLNLPDKFPARLKEHFEAKFQPVKTPLFFNIFQSQILYRSVAVQGMAAIIIGFFIVNRPGEEIHVQKPEHVIARVAPIKAREKPGKVQQPVLVPVNVKLKRPVRVAALKMERDTIITETSGLLGLDVYEPILCLDIDLNGQVPGLNDQPLTN